MKNIFFISCALMLVICPAYCQGTLPINIKTPGVHELDIHLLQKHLVKCSINVVHYSEEMMYNRRWGSDWDNPRTVIAEIKVWLDKRQVLIPLSSYADLSNPNQAYLEDAKSGYSLVIRGGDAATGYKATIDFSGDKASRRVVRSGEFPDEAWEITTYSKPDTIR
ncbi:MAG: hypothetical protein WAO19_13100 [Candidatus Kryptoniota bacterium]